MKTTGKSRDLLSTGEKEGAHSIKLCDYFWSPLLCKIADIKCGVEKDFPFSLLAPC